MGRRGKRITTHGPVSAETRMRVLLVVTILLSLFLESSGEEKLETGPDPRYSCPEMDVDFGSNDVDNIHGITDWRACGTICDITPPCKFWTMGFYNTCWLKSSDAGLSVDFGAISGAKGCK